MSLKEYHELLSHCSRFLSGSYPETWKMKSQLLELASMVDEDAFPDTYGEGEVIEAFEAEVARLLGKDAALFLPSGTMAQQIALRIWSDRKGIKNIAFHPKCHLEIHERKGYQMLHGLSGILVGQSDRLITLDDLKAVLDPLAALLFELPQREIGGQLPAWDDLVIQTNWARERGIALHMDGARLWECAPFYERSYAEMASLFDTVYVSFYKGLGGITGSALAGPKDFVREARAWQRRYGGNLIRMYPFVLSARQGLDRYLPKMAAWHEKAMEVAGVLSAFSQVEVVPNSPPTNMMHVFIRGDRERLEKASREIARECGVLLFYSLGPSQIETYSKVEITIKDPGLDLTAEEIHKYFEMLFEKAKE